MTPIETAAVFAGIPAAIFGLIAVLVYGTNARRTARYRPGRSFVFAPVWFLAGGSAAANHSTGAHGTGTSGAHGAGAHGTGELDGGGLPAGGGAHSAVEARHGLVALASPKVSSHDLTEVRPGKGGARGTW
jgi:hypothetical protein